MCLLAQIDEYIINAKAKETHFYKTFVGRESAPRLREVGQFNYDLILLLLDINTVHRICKDGNSYH